MVKKREVMICCKQFVVKMGKYLRDGPYMIHGENADDIFSFLQNQNLHNCNNKCAVNYFLQSFVIA